MADISIRGVRKSFGKLEVVHGVDLEFKNREFVVILGPSGCGKSTLLRMIAGLEGINAGEIAIAGRVVNKLEPRERGCAMVFQNYALYPHMTVAENIGYALKVAGQSRAERRRRVGEVAKILDLEPYLDRKPAQLSGGQRQRVAMGRAIVREPQVFLFDEPLSNLDAKLRVQMRIEIRRLHARLAATSVFVTHDQIEAMTLADRLVVMNAGRVEQVGTPAEVYHRPATRFVGGFIGSPPMNFLAGTVSGDGARVLLSGGNSLPFDPERYAVAPGQPVEIGIRPEQVMLLEGQRDGQPSARFELLEELGAGRLVYLDLDGSPLIAATSEERAFKPGERVPVRISPDAVHLFSPENGRRLEGSGQVLREAAE